MEEEVEEEWKEEEGLRREEGEEETKEKGLFKIYLYRFIRIFRESAKLNART